jgi:hypothetical protein
MTPPLTNKSTWASENAAFLVLLERFPLEKWLTRHGFKPQGRQRNEYLQTCPWCGGEDKLSINPQRRKWRCLRCARGFSLLELIAEYEGGFPQAAELVRLSAGGRSLALIPEDPHADRAVVERPRFWQPAPIDPPPYFEHLRGHHPYTAKRGFDLDNLMRLGVGICTWGLYQDRLVFPVRDYAGGWIYFQTRATWEKSEHDEARFGKYRKNLNPANQDPARFASASDVVLGLEYARAHARIAIVEGPTDWLQSGPDAVATFGKVISEQQIRLLVMAGIREVDLAYDPDSWLTDRPGKTPPAQLAAEKLAPHFTVRVVRYPDGADPGSYTVAENRAWRAQAQPIGALSKIALIP